MGTRVIREDVAHIGMMYDLHGPAFGVGHNIHGLRGSSSFGLRFIHGYFIFDKVTRVSLYHSSFGSNIRLALG